VSNSVLVLVEGAVEEVVSAYVEADDLSWVVDGAGECAQWGGGLQWSVGPVLVVVRLVLAQRVAEVALAPDDGAVEEFAAQAEYPVGLGKSSPQVKRRTGTG
jgi:hypothetical protein